MTDPFGCFVGAPVLQAGRPGAMTVAVKDNIDMAGLPTLAGLGGAGLGGGGIMATADAAIVARLRHAGMALLGKARMDEAACGAAGDNPHHGRTENPAAPRHSPGGSSGGCAASIAAGLCEGALGTDTLGSVRIPAGYCGVIGMKPTRGVLPMAGIVPLSWTLDHAGLLGATVDAVARLLEVFLPHDTPSAAPMRIGVPVLAGIAAEVASACRQALIRAGWDPAACSIPRWDPADTRRAGLLVLEAEGAAVHEALLASDSPALSPGLRRMLAYGRDCGSVRLVRALHVLRLAADGLEEALGRFDLIAMPTVANPAFAWTDGPPANQADLTALANFGGHPAISVPVGKTADGRPIGLQLIGRRGADWAVVEAARHCTC